MSKTLEHTLERLRRHPDATNARLSAVSLGNYFTVVGLEDGSVGACMSSYRLSETECRSKHQEVNEALLDDPLLLSYTKFSTDKVRTAIRAATISALSAKPLMSGKDSTFRIENNFPSEYFANANKAVVIGFGGLLQHLIHSTSVREIHVSDLRYKDRKLEIDRSLNQLRRVRAGVIITASDGHDNSSRIKKADTVCITGSTLGNGTLDELLAASRKCDRTILQGQSASILPTELFRAGVSAVFTTMKTPAVLNAAMQNDGLSLRKFLEPGGLPPIYFWPTVERRRRFWQLRSINP
jgi:uncharacterized protein (DUF4213/DUF364 family)